MENNLLPLIHQVMKADMCERYQAKFSGLEMQGNLNFLILWESLLQIKRQSQVQFFGTHSKYIHLLKSEKETHTIQNNKGQSFTQCDPRNRINLQN